MADVARATARLEKTSDGYVWPPPMLAALQQWGGAAARLHQTLTQLQVDLEVAKAVIATRIA